MQAHSQVQNSTKHATNIYKITSETNKFTDSLSGAEPRPLHWIWYTWKSKNQDNNNNSKRKNMPPSPILLHDFITMYQPLHAWCLLSSNLTMNSIDLYWWDQSPYQAEINMQWVSYSLEDPVLSRQPKWIKRSE